MKKLLCIVLAACLLMSNLAIVASAYGLKDPDIMTVDEAIEEFEFLWGEEVATNRYYFLMPTGTNGDLGDDESETGHAGEYTQSWYKAYEDGTLATDTAGIYWWDSDVADPPAWVGYLPSGSDENDPNVYYADVPQAVTTIIWNNAIDGGEDASKPDYYCAAQTCNIPCEYYDPYESPNYPDGTESFDGMIFVTDPDLVTENELSGMQELGGEWYYYYGNGCYGFTKDGTEADCLRHDHFDADGNHVVPEAQKPTSAPSEEPTEEPTEAPTDAPTEAPTEAPTTEPEYATGVLHFDANTTGWENIKKVYCHIWVYGGASLAGWQSKKEACTDTDGDGVWTYDLESKGFELEVGKLYAVIFSSGNDQTYDLLFDTTVFGDEAYCDGTFYENPADSSKMGQAAFWRGQNPAQYGPVKCITSIGNVVGTCVPSVTTPQDMLEEVLADPAKLENIRTYSMKEDQAIVDDIANGLGLTLEQAAEAVANSGAELAWSAENSTITGPTYELGDVDGDGEIGISDVSAIQRHLAKLEILSDEALERADATKDGSVDIIDATRIQLYVAQYITEF